MVAVVTSDDGVEEEPDTKLQKYRQNTIRMGLAASAVVAVVAMSDDEVAEHDKEILRE